MCLNETHDCLLKKMPTKKLEFENPHHVEKLYCGQESNLKLAERELGVDIVVRDNWIQFEGTEKEIENAAHFFGLLGKGRSQGIHIHTADFENVLNGYVKGDQALLEELFNKPMVIKVRNKTIVPRTINQKRYLKFIQRHDIVFGIGPAGTGKTYIAVAAAIQALLNKEIDKIIISRPAVEAGEALGFLPGDLTEKIDPYLRPIYDAMNDLIGTEDRLRMMDKGVIEIAPLAYMRGRTLSNAFVMLDEAQNTTPEQMMMFLTRLGENSRMIITGDITQVDLPRAKTSGLKQAVQVLGRTEGIKLFYFEHSDVVRHKLVSRIIQAYEQHLKDNK